MRIVFNLLLVFIFSTGSFAQKADVSFKRFGFVARINIANMNFNKGVPAPSVPVDATWKAGISIGILLNVPLNEKLLLQPQYLYTKRNGADKSIKVDYHLDYISLPLLLKYNVTSIFDVVAGPQVELLISAESNNNGVNSNITHDVEERSIGATAGFDFKLIRSFFLSARYLYGLNHIGIGQRSNVKEFKYEEFSLSAGIEF